MRGALGLGSLDCRSRDQGLMHFFHRRKIACRLGFFFHFVEAVLFLQFVDVGIQVGFFFFDLFFRQMSRGAVQSNSEIGLMSHLRRGSGV